MARRGIPDVKGEPARVYKNMSSSEISVNGMLILFRVKILLEMSEQLFEFDYHSEERTSEEEVEMISDSGSSSDCESTIDIGSLTFSSDDASLSYSSEEGATIPDRGEETHSKSPRVEKKKKDRLEKEENLTSSGISGVVTTGMSDNRRKRREKKRDETVKVSEIYEVFPHHIQDWSAEFLKSLREKDEERKYYRLSHLARDFIYVAETYDPSYKY